MGGPQNSGLVSKPVKRWFALLPDFVLYTFRNETDIQAQTATPMPGYTIVSGPELKGDPTVAEKDRDRVIKMCYAPAQHPMANNQGAGINSLAASTSSLVCRKAYYFAGTSTGEVERYN